MRSLDVPYVVVPPRGARVRTRLRVDDRDAAVLATVAEHLGHLAGRDLAARCALGRGDGERAPRKRALTALSSSRWAGAITRTSQDQWATAMRNLRSELAGLRRRIEMIESRLAVPVGARVARVRGYATRRERFEKQRRLQSLRHRLTGVEARLAKGRVSVVRGGRRLARARHQLDAAGLDEAQWRERWDAARWFICADGEAGTRLGNQTIRFYPDEGSVDIRLPTPLAHHANQPHGRYRLSCAVRFLHRGDEVAAQAVSGAVRYDVSFDPVRRRWYLDASWTVEARPVPTVKVAAKHGVVAVDLNADHLTVWVVDPAGNPRGLPHTIPLILGGLPASTRDARIRAAVTAVLGLARAHEMQAVAIEDLDFADVRQGGRETLGGGARGRRFRRVVHGLPTRALRDRLVQMAANRGLWVVAVDPAYTSKWGGQHWQAPLNRQTSPDVTVTRHQAAAVVIGRRSLGYGARRRPGVTKPHQRMGPGELPARPATAPEAARNEEHREAHRLRSDLGKTSRAQRARSPDQATQDRSGSPVSEISRP